MTKKEQQEVEANQFATAILMPLLLVKEHLIEVIALATKHHWGAEEIVAEMAKRFQVSEARMALRIGQLEEIVP